MVLTLGWVFYLFRSVRGAHCFGALDGLLPLIQPEGYAGNFRRSLVVSVSTV